MAASRDGDRQGAVPGITVHKDGSFTIDTPEAIEFYRIKVIISGLRLEVKCPGLKASRFSSLKAAQHFYGCPFKTKVKALEFMEKVGAAVELEMNNRKGQPS